MRKTKSVRPLSPWQSLDWRVFLGFMRLGTLTKMIFPRGPSCHTLSSHTSIVTVTVTKT